MRQNEEYSKQDGGGRKSKDFNSYLANPDISLYDSCQYKQRENEVKPSKEPE
jgi:hypothetical protein